MTGQQGEREALAALRRIFDKAKPSVTGRRSGKTALMDDLGTVTRVILAAQPPRVTPSAEEVRRAVAPVLCNAANYGDAIAPHVLGRDMSPVIDKTTDAVLALFAAQPTVQQVREQVAAEIEAEANARAKRRDEHRDVSIRTRHDDAEAASMHMETAQAFRSEAIGLYDAARIARGEKGGE